MSEAITVARPYALAAFDEARKNSELKNWSEVLQSAVAAVENEQVHALITSPRVAKNSCRI